MTKSYSELAFVKAELALAQAELAVAKLQNFRFRTTLKAVQQAFLDNDRSTNKSNPWIPGISAGPLKALVNETLAVNYMYEELL